MFFLFFFTNYSFKVPTINVYYIETVNVVIHLHAVKSTHCRLSSDIIVILHQFKKFFFFMWIICYAIRGKKI